MGSFTPRLRAGAQALLVGALLALAVAVTRWSIGWASVGRMQPRAQHGVLDLTAWDWSTQGPIYLVGDWEFRWERETRPPAPTVVWTQVPSLWKQRPTDGWPGEGYATYVLRVYLPPSPGWLALRVPYQRTAYRLWVNGLLAAANGKVGSVREQSRPQYLPQLIVLPPPRTTAPIVLVMQISNFHHRAGGFYQPLALGTPRQVQNLDTRALLTDWLVMAFILAVGLHYLTVYLLRRNEQAALYLGLLSLVMVLRMLVMREMYLVRWFPNFPWELHLKIEYGTMCALLPLLVSFARHSLPDVVAARLPRTVTIVSLIYALLVLFTPARLYSRTVAAYQMLGLLCCAYLTARGFEAVRRHLAGAIAFSGSTICLTLAVTHDVITTTPLPSSAAWTPVGVACGILLQSIFLAQRFAGSLTAQERLAAELRHSRHLVVEADAQLRRQVCAHLHGQVQGQLLAAWLQLGQSLQSWSHSPRRARQLVEQVRRELDHLREREIRQLSHQLYPAILEAGLIPALYSLLDRFSSPPQIRLGLDPALPASLPDEVQLALYRLVEEAVNNSQRHAHAHSITIALRRLAADETAPERLQVQVEDDGYGFDVRRVPLGFGLAIATARIEDLDGTWQLDSSPGRGTRLVATVPLTRPGQSVAPARAAAPANPVTPSGNAMNR